MTQNREPQDKAEKANNAPPTREAHGAGHDPEHHKYGVGVEINTDKRKQEKS